MGAACVWRTQEGWTGRRYHQSTNKEVFDAETSDIYQALRALTSGRRAATDTRCLSTLPPPSTGPTAPDKITAR